MATPYEDLQREGSEAFARYQNHKIRACYVINTVAELCVTKLGIPQQNIQFHPTDKPTDENGRAHAEAVIDRDDHGKWHACMSVKVNAQGGWFITNLFLDVEVLENTDAKLCLRDDAYVAHISKLPGASESAFDGFLQRVTEKASESNKWLATGSGNKPPIGFGSVSLT